jgi:hypothetical protein
VSAQGFDAYLELLDGHGNVIETDDDSGGGASAQLTTSVEAGTYYVVVKPFVDQGYTVGLYTIVVR